MVRPNCNTIVLQYMMAEYNTKRKYYDSEFSSDI